MNTPAPKFNATPVDKGMGTQSEVSGQGGANAGGISGSTRANTAALGGVNFNKMTSPKVVYARASKAPAKANVKAPKPVKYSRTAKPNPASEADAGDMSHYDPNLGMGKK